MPRVSVIIPAFNSVLWVSAAIDSVLSQGYRDYEVVVVDDGSTDRTAAVLESYGKKIRCIYQANAGVSSARNRGLSESTSEFIAYLDADDMWYSQKLDRQIAFLDAHPNCGLVHSDVTIIDEQDKVIRARFNVETARPIPSGYCLQDLLRHCHIQVPSVVERRACIEEVGGFDEQFMATEDYLHWIMVSLKGWEFGYINEPLAKYRWRPGSVSSNKRLFLDEYRKMFGVLLPALYENRPKSPDLAIIRKRFLQVERELAYMDCVEGQLRSARQRLMRLIQRSPLQYNLYWDLAKTYLR
jgi:glycosyltransferase involved in cell wall biosynthesis